MQQKQFLTNENLIKRFDNPFALVNYAIGLAKEHVLQGEWVDTNPVNEVLEILTGNEENIETEEESTAA